MVNGCTLVFIICLGFYLTPVLLGGPRDQVTAGFEEITAGTLELDGRSLANVRPYRRNIGMVFQNYALFPHMTTETNVAFPLKMRKFPRDRKPDKPPAASADSIDNPMGICHGPT